MKHLLLALTTSLVFSSPASAMLRRYTPTLLKKSPSPVSAINLLGLTSAMMAPHLTNWLLPQLRLHSDLPAGAQQRKVKIPRRFYVPLSIVGDKDLQSIQEFSQGKTFCHTELFRLKKLPVVEITQQKKFVRGIIKVAIKQMAPGIEIQRFNASDLNEAKGIIDIKKFIATVAARGLLEPGDELGNTPGNSSRFENPLEDLFSQLKLLGNDLGRHPHGFDPNPWLNHEVYFGYGEKDPSEYHIMAIYNKLSRECVILMFSNFGRES